MKERWLLKAADKTLNGIIWFLILVLFLYSGLGLWDAYCIYQDAGNSNLIAQYKPTGDGKDNPTLTELQALNPDVCAWLTVEGTSIDYPVVQGESNMEYINKSVDGNFSLSGSLFLDYRNDREFQDFYSLIYGHHMAGDVMFGSLPSFQKADFFEAHPSATLFLPDETRKITLFACVHTDAYDTTIFNPECKDDTSKKHLIAWIKEKSVQYREIGVTEQDQVIGFSTCYDTTTNGRIIVFGKFQQTGAHF